MKTKKINSLKFFLFSQLNVSSKKVIPVEREIFHGETFFLIGNIEKEEVKKLIKKYFEEISGNFELIAHDDELSLHFSYKIEEESGMGTVTFFPNLGKIWVTTVIT